MKQAAAIRTRWGILGTTTAAQQFALGLAYLANARLIAIGARSQVAADMFGDGNWVPRRYGSFEALVDDPDIDAVYVATPPEDHGSVVRMCLDAGKAVVCDLPFASNTDEVADLIACARKRELFLMAGPWMRFLPLSARVRALLAEGVIGQPQRLIAEVGVLPPFDLIRQARDEQPDSIVLASAGALLVALAAMLLGAPTRVVSQARLGSSAGGQATTILTHAGGQMSTLLAATRGSGPQEATIVGDGGWIRIHARWWTPKAFTLTAGVTERVVPVPIVGNAASHIADEAMRCLRNGRLESEVMPLDEMLAIVRTLDQMREQWELSAVGVPEPR
jgi:dihydrodiol dehydrogenase / D-xylose 1-dehydrogenase (NADP)